MAIYILALAFISALLSIPTAILRRESASQFFAALSLVTVMLAMLVEAF